MQLLRVGDHKTVIQSSQKHEWIIMAKGT